MSSLSSFLPWIQIVLSVLLTGAVLLQQNDASLGSAFGGSQMGGAVHTKRGLEKQLFVAAIFISILFLISTVLALFVK